MGFQKRAAHPHPNLREVPPWELNNVERCVLHSAIQFNIVLEVLHGFKSVNIMTNFFGKNCIDDLSRQKFDYIFLFATVLVRLQTNPHSCISGKQRRM